LQQAVPQTHPPALQPQTDLPASQQAALNAMLATMRSLLSAAEPSLLADAPPTAPPIALLH
jgi:hypothetical protein